MWRDEDSQLGGYWVPQHPLCRLPVPTPAHPCHSGEAPCTSAPHPEPQQRPLVPPPCPPPRPLTLPGPISGAPGPRSPTLPRPTPRAPDSPAPPSSILAPRAAAHAPTGSRQRGLLLPARPPVSGPRGRPGPRSRVKWFRHAASTILARNFMAGRWPARGVRGGDSGPLLSFPPETPPRAHWFRRPARPGGGGAPRSRPRGGGDPRPRPRGGGDPPTVTPPGRRGLGPGVRERASGVTLDAGHRGGESGSQSGVAPRGRRGPGPRPRVRSGSRSHPEASGLGP